MSEVGLFRDFAVIIGVSGVAALIFYYLKQPVVLGYLLAGFVVGPYSWGPSFVSDTEVMAFMGELGIVFLLFALGLEFSLSKLRKVGAAAILAGTIEIVVMLSLGYGLGRMLGWAPLESIFLGAIMSISSTTIIVKVLAERGQKDEDWAHTAFGILIIEDVLAVVILTALSSAGATGNFDPALLTSLAWKLSIFLGAALLIGLLVAPRLVDRLAALKVEEVGMLLATGAGFGMALLAGSLGFSAGLGAFIAGALMAESPRVAKLTHRIEPLRDLFTAIFFVTVGAALQPAALVASWLPILVVTIGVVVGKIAAVTLALFVTGAKPGKALRVGMTLAQIGEFAFIIAALGATLGAAPPSLYAIAISVSAISAFLTPHLIRWAPDAAAAAGRRLPSGIHAYLASYAAWLGRMKRSDPRGSEWRGVRLNLVTATLNGAAIVAVFAVGSAFQGELRSAIADATSLPKAADALAWLAVSLVATPFAFMWVRETKEIVLALARMAVPQRLRGAECTLTERLLRRTFGFVATVLTAIVVLALGSLLFEEPLYVVLLAGVGVAIGSVVLGSTLRKFHAEVESTIQRMTEDDSVGTRQEAIEILQGSAAWGATRREIVLPAVSGGAGRTIGQLRLRELTGASVVTVRGVDGSTVTLPGPERRLLAGDHVTIVGDIGALLRAEEILIGRELGIEGGATEVSILAGSRLIGVAHRALGLDERVTILVVHRAGDAIEASPGTLIEAGDVLVLSGPDDAVESARRALAS